MRVLVVGSNGLLGGNVVETAREQGFEAAGTYHMSKPSFEIPLEKLDLREVEQLRSIVNEFSPHVVVNCAAMTDVDGCESDPDTACAVNGDAPGVIAEICDEANSYLVHVSTDYVFDGCARRPYKESDDPSPKQVYGESKLAGERSVRDTEADALVTRLSFVYGIHRSNGELTGFPAWVSPIST